MRVGEAKAIARQWVMEEAARESAILAAYFAGSTNWKPDDEALPDASDVDVKLVVEDSDAFPSYFKQPHHGIILEVSYGSSDQYSSAERVLSSYYTAKHFTTASAIYDPSGMLARLQAKVQEAYAQRKWVLRRCEDVRNWLTESLTWFAPTAPYHEQNFCVFYPLVVAAQIFSVADLRNPTVRQAGIVAAEVAAQYDCMAIFERWLELVGSRHMRREQVEALTADTMEAVANASPHVKTSFFGSTSLTGFSRALVADGFRRMIDQGYPRETVLWLAWHQALSQKTLYLDAPEDVRAQGTIRFQHFLDALGITSPDALYQRRQQLIAFVPDLWAATEHILATNPNIVD